MLNSTTQAESFDARLVEMLEWVAERDPVTAARLVAEWQEEVLLELGDTDELVMTGEPAAA